MPSSVQVSQAQNPNHALSLFLLIQNGNNNRLVFFTVRSKWCTHPHPSDLGPSQTLSAFSLKCFPQGKDKTYRECSVLFRGGKWINCPSFSDRLQDNTIGPLSAGKVMTVDANYFLENQNTVSCQRIFFFFCQMCVRVFSVSWFPSLMLVNSQKYLTGRGFAR